MALDRDRLLRLVNESAGLPERAVSPDEFVRLLVERGGLTAAEARVQLMLAAVLGSACRAGHEMIRPAVEG